MLQDIRIWFEGEGEGVFEWAKSHWVAELSAQLEINWGGEVWEWDKMYWGYKCDCEVFGQIKQYVCIIYPLNIEYFAKAN